MAIADLRNDRTLPKKVIITVFHYNRLSQGKAPVNPMNEDHFNRDLTEIICLSLPGIWSFDTRGVSEGIAQYMIPYHEPLDCAAIRKSPAVARFETTYGVEIIFDQFITTGQYVHRPIKLALFDMDSTLINEEVIDELARSIGISDAVSAITARAMNGDIDFATSLKERVAMLKGVPTTVWNDLKETVTIADGARELIAGLKQRGVYTGVVSGGFTPMAEWLKQQLGLDVAIANHLVESPVSDQYPFPHLSGELDPKYPIVTPQLKRDTLLRLLEERSIPIHETLAVGDGSNDLLMLGVAGLGIAWKAKAKVQIAAPMRLNGTTLADLLFLLGDADENAEEKSST